ncbi:MAG TPA: hypothetical protein VFL60_08355 [Gaiellaceae bacterium]|nr:hypothetical protein [Gaiellaceae bacterium]
MSTEADTHAKPPVPALAAEDVPGDWRQIQDEWRDRNYTTLRRAVAALEGDAVDAVDDLLFGADAGAAERAREVLHAAFAAAAASADGPLLLALYVHGRCLEKWERTEDYARIGAVLAALAEAAGTGVPDWAADPVSARMLDLVVRQAQAVTAAMSVEDGLRCSCPVAVGSRSRAVVDAVERVLADELALGEGLGELRDVVRTDAETTLRYFQAIERIADVVLTFVQEEVPRAVDYFDDVLAALDGVAKGDVYESELRAHAACLESLRGSSAKPRLHVAEARVLYLWPFALRAKGHEPGADTDDAVVARVRRGELASFLAERGFDAAPAEELELNDLWVVPESPEPGFGGASIMLPELAVRTTAGYWLEPFTVQIRLSRLGNHEVRIESRLADAGLHEVNQALRRGSYAMGAEEIRSGSRTWDTLSAYVEDVVRAVADGLESTAVVDLASRFHVVLGARAMSVVDETGRARPAALADLERCVGSTLLLHPVQHLATALEEWARYPEPSVANLVAGEGFAGDLVARTDNTTVLFMPSSPEWLIDEYEEMIDFMASIPSLMNLWERIVSERDRDLEQALDDEPPIEVLHQHRRRILELERLIRGRLAFLHSQALCRTRAQRRFLDQLWTAAGLDALEAQLESRLALLSDRERRIAAMVSVLDERRRRRQGARVEMVLAFLAAAAVSGVVLWFMEAFSVNGRSWAWGEAGVQLAIAAVVVGLIFRLRRSE